MEKLAVGFIGLGIMGRPMAGHLLRAGYPLTVFNRTRDKGKDLESRGARVASSPSEVAARSEVIITMVSDSPDVQEVVAGERGVLEGIRPGSIVIDMSTISPEVERRLNRQLAEKGCQLVDAPVSGGDIGAQKATLAIMAGGSPEAFKKVKPLFEVLGKTITYCGPVGCGQLTKLCNQILVSLNLLAVSEALAFAEANELDPGTMIAAVAGGAAGSWQLSNLGPRIVQGDYAPGFMVDLIQKDLRLVFECAERTGVPLPGTSLIRQFFVASRAAGWGQEGTQAVAKIVKGLAGVPRS